MKLESSVKEEVEILKKVIEEIEKFSKWHHGQGESEQKQLLVMRINQLTNTIWDEKSTREQLRFADRLRTSFQYVLENVKKGSDVK